MSNEHFDVDRRSSEEDLAVLPKDCVRRALLVATGHYDDDRIPLLPGVHNDVDLIKERLLDQSCGFKDDDVVVLKTDDSKYTRPTLKNIKKKLDDFLSDCKENEFIFLFFAGHGFRDSKTNVEYYVPSDANCVPRTDDDVSYDPAECYSFENLRERLGVCRAKYKWVVVDVCRAVFHQDHFNPFKYLYRSYPKEVGRESEAKCKEVNGSLWFQSCKASQRSYEYQSVDGNNPTDYHSLFTWYFCEGAKGETTDSTGQISPMMLFDYACNHMREYCKKEKGVPAQIPDWSCPNLSNYKFIFIKSDAEAAYKKAEEFCSKLQFTSAHEEIQKALKFYPTNEKYKKYKEGIEKLLPSKEQQPNNPPKAASKELPIDYLDSKGKEYRLIKAGSFWMGSPLTGKEVVQKYTTYDYPQWFDNSPRHFVTLTNDFYLAKRPVTRGEFQQFVDATGYKTTAEKEGSAWTLTKSGNWEDVKGKYWRDPGFEQTNDHPVVCVSYFDALEYIDWLNKTSLELNGIKPIYRLPTESEWEYACRAGKTTEFFWGDEEKDGKGYLNASGTEKNLVGQTRKYHFPFDVGYPATSPVGSFKPNDWNLYDMLGNVWEWTSDWYGDYPKEATTDPKGATSGSYRVLRGGGWSFTPAYCRCAYRDYDAPEKRLANYGMRVAFSLTK